MIPVKITELPSNYGDFCYILEAPCFICGNIAEGRVAASRKIEGASKKIAEEWAADLRSGKAMIKCSSCRKLDNAKRVSAIQRKVVTQRTH